MTKWTYHDAGEWQIRTRPAREPTNEPWYGEAKRKSDGEFAKHALLEPTNCDIYFEFGRDEAEVVRKLKRELLN